MTTYYASPTGASGNNGLTQGAPFRVQDFWAVAVAGDTLNLLDGTYQGAAHMIHPALQGAPANLSGTNGNPITVRALNDGMALIDGQFARAPVRLQGNSWFVLEGFNAKQSGGVGNPVVFLAGGSNNNVVRRVIAWDTPMDQNVDTIKSTSSDNLFEDVAAFGVGRKTFAFTSFSGNRNTCRRCWGRWEGSIQLGPKLTATLHYNTVGTVFENSIFTWSGESMPQSYNLHSNGVQVSPTQSFTNFGVEQARAVVDWDRNDPVCPNPIFRVSGSLVYVKSAATTYTWTQAMLRTNHDCFRIEHTFLFMQPGHPNFGSQRGFALDVVNQATSGAVATRLTSVAGVTDFFETGVQTSNNSHGTSLAAVPSPWTSTTTGANLCNRWVNGAVTTEPLWPWPMNARIKAATAAAGAYTGPCPTCSGGRFTRTETDVTADVEALLGTIPSSCRTPVSSSSPSIAEAVTVAEARQVIITNPVTNRDILKVEAVAVTETATIKLAQLRISVSDTAAIADAIGRLLKNFISESEGVTLTETVTLTLTTQSAAVSISESDSIAVSEAIVRAISVVGEATPPPTPAPSTETTSTGTPTASVTISAGTNLGAIISRIRERLHDT